MTELKLDHQLCTFHLEKHLWELVNKEANKIAKKYRAQLKKENPNFSKTKLSNLFLTSTSSIINILLFIRPTFISIFFIIR